MPIKRKIKLVGGPSHGEVVTLNEGARDYRVAEETPIQMWGEPAADKVHFSYVDYLEKPVYADNNLIGTIWCPSWMSVAQALRLVLRDFNSSS